MNPPVTGGSPHKGTVMQKVLPCHDGITLEIAANMGTTIISWWRHQMKTFSVLLAICAGNSPVPGEFPAQRPVGRRFDVFFDLRLNKRLSNNREAGDLRRYRAHCDVTIIFVSHQSRESTLVHQPRRQTLLCSDSIQSQKWNRKLAVNTVTW